MSNLSHHLPLNLDPDFKADDRPLTFCSHDSRHRGKQGERKRKRPFSEPNADPGRSRLETCPIGLIPGSAPTPES